MIRETMQLYHNCRLIYFNLGICAVPGVNVISLLFNLIKKNTVNTKTGINTVLFNIWQIGREKTVTLHIHSANIVSNGRD